MRALAVGLVRSALDHTLRLPPVTRSAGVPPSLGQPGLWPAAPLVAVGLGVAVLALPSGVEGPPVVAISPGHALSAVDALGVLPLTAGAVWLQAGLWRRRAVLARWAGARPGAAAAWFGAGLGLGLLLASAFSRFFWWWAVGAAVLAGAGGALLVVVARGWTNAGEGEAEDSAGTSRPWDPGAPPCP